jgi:hypothetical protein
MLEEVYQLCSEGKVQKAMEDFYTVLHTELLHGRYEECDALLSSLDPTRCPPIVSIGALRACFPVREKLKSWIPLLEEIKEMDVKPRLLRGLL